MFSSILSLLTFVFAPALASTTISHTLSEFNQPPLYDETFEHLSYVNKNAPKGGRLNLSAPGTFDTFNSLILLGTLPRGGLLSLTQDTLMTLSKEELGVAYGLLATRVEYPQDLSWVEFTLHPQASFHDGHPITAEDFVFTWEMIMRHGRPFLQSFYEAVETVEAVTPKRLRLTFTTKNTIKSLITVATVFSPEPEHWWRQPERDISKTTLEPILGSGPYRIGAVNPGRSITYERVEEYWGATHPLNVGRYNFDLIDIDYYRDDGIRFEAFKAESYDFRIENRAQWWAKGYDDSRGYREGRIIKRRVQHQTPMGAQGFYFNVRRPQFSDPRVREALASLFDFEWTQRTLFHGEYIRLRTNFPNSEFGVGDEETPSAAESQTLDRFREQIPPRVFSASYHPSKTDGSGNIPRDTLRQALALLREAGWEIDSNRLVHAETGEPMRIEFLERAQSSMIRVISPYVDNLKRLGIDATIRAVEHLEYSRRLEEFNYDVVALFLSFQYPPGLSLRSYFGSQAAEIQGSANYSGVQDEVVDQLIEDILVAESLDEVKVLSKALDRVLLWGFYMVPHWYTPDIRLAYWDKFGQPETLPPYNPTFIDTWWRDD